MSAPKLDPVLAHIDAHIESTTQHLFDLLRIPSISTDPAFKAEIRPPIGWWRISNQLALTPAKDQLLAIRWLWPIRGPIPVTRARM